MSTLERAIAIAAGMVRGGDRRSHTAAWVGVLLAALACSSGEAPDRDTAAPETTAPDSAGSGAEPDARTEATAEPADDPTDTATWTIGIASAPPTTDAPPLPVLTELRVGTHPDYERVTFEVAEEAGGAPGYHVEYVDRPLVECGSGRQIFPVGDGWLEIRLEPAAAHTEAGEPTLGPREVAVDGPLLERIYRTCDFEGIVTYVLALASPDPYRVVRLDEPRRVVVDVRR